MTARQAPSPVNEQVSPVSQNGKAETEDISSDIWRLILAFGVLGMSIPVAATVVFLSAASFVAVSAMLCTICILAVSLLAGTLFCVSAVAVAMCVLGYLAMVAGGCSVRLLCFDPCCCNLFIDTGEFIRDSGRR